MSMMRDPFSNVPPVPPFTAAAAVLTSFDPATLHPAGEIADPELALSDLLLDCEPATEGGEATRWRLEESTRREALLRLSREPDGLRRALAANAGQRPEEPVQRALEELINGGDASKSLDERSLDDLLALARASDWLTGAVGQLPSREQLLGQIDRERLLKPFRRLLARGFVGRSRELAHLHRFLRDERGSRVLSLHGPGGVGKSTLLARFIMEVAAPDGVGRGGDRRNFLFAYLDVDRTVLDPQDPASFAKEAARQLKAQNTTVHDLAEKVQRSLTSVASRTETTYFESATAVTFEAGALLTQVTTMLFKETGRPVLIVVDTWEEIQAAGGSGEAGMIGLVAELAASPSVRIVCAGRAPLRTRGEAAFTNSWVGVTSFKAEKIPIESFDEPTAEAYLAGVAHVPPEAVSPIIRAVGTNPLSLALAARVVEREGRSAVADLTALVARIKAEQLQGQLYTRLLGHVHHKELQSLVHPGLAVRRITPNIIRHVLAEPCGMVISDDARAEELFLSLADESALVEPDEDETPINVRGELRSPLRCRPDLRRLALPDLQRTMPEQVAAIHAAAIKWYVGQEGLRARAEEIYHRLANGELPPIELWHPGVERWLRASSLPELPARGRVWLLRQLNQPLDAETRAAADLESWERDTAEQVRACLARREWQLALALLHERFQRGPASPLWLLEAQALVQSGALVEAEAFLRKGAAAVAEQGELGPGFELLLLLAEVQARRGDFQAALLTLDDAEPFTFAATELDRLRRLVAQLRMRRKLGVPDPAEDEIRAEAIGFVEKPEITRNLERRPALLRETVAELGNERTSLVVLAIRLLGIGRVRLPPHLAPLRLPAWMARLLARLVSGTSSYNYSRLGERRLRLTIDLMRAAMARDAPSGSASLALAELGAVLVRRLQDDARPAFVAWCVELYRAELDAISAGQVELDQPTAFSRAS